MEEETMESFPVALSSNLHENSEGDRDFSLVLFTQDHQGQQTLGGRHFGDLESGTNEVGEVDIEENKVNIPSTENKHIVEKLIKVSHLNRPVW